MTPSAIFAAAVLRGLFLAAADVLPADRLAMADRLFNKGRCEAAAAEYRALEGQDGVAPDEIAFRLAECDRQSGRTEAARKRYETVFRRYPESRHAAQARFLFAMGASGQERRRLLTELDTDRVEVEIRTAALYHLGSEAGDAEILAKCVALAPKGRYAPYANLKYGMLLNASSDPGERRKGVEVLLGLAFGGGPLAEEALYLAAIQSYREKRYDEAGSLFRRYRRNHPGGANAAEARTMSAWCDFLGGRYADAAATCGEGESDDLAYIRAACAYATGDSVRALELFRKYLDDYPAGRYRADAELPVARIEFEAAEKGGEAARILETARRGFALSSLAADELRLAWAYEKAGRTDEAVAEYARLAARFPGSEEAAEAMFRSALVSVRRGEWSAAELALSEALAGDRLGRHRAEALYWCGTAALQLGHEVQGAGYLEQAVKAGLGMDEEREARLALADLDLRGGRTEAAKKAYAALVREGACERMSASRLLSVGRLVGGEEAETCAKALAAGTSPEWRQAGWALLGACREQAGSFVAAAEAYRKALAETAVTAEAAKAALRLGLLELRAGDHVRADETLKRAVALNAADAHARAEAYLALARNARAAGDAKTAVAYATVVTSLFNEPAVCAEARAIVEEGGGAAKPEAGR